MVTLAELSEQFLAHVRVRRKTNTVHAYVTSWRRLLAVMPNDLRVQELRTPHIDAYVAAERKRGCLPATINARLRTLKASLRWAASEDVGLLDAMPKARITPLTLPARRPRSGLSPQDVTRLVAATNTTRDRSLVLLIASSGLRIDEALHLRWGDLNGRCVTVRASEEWSPKSGRARDVWISSRVADLLSSFRVEQGNPPDEAWVFTSRTGGGRLKTVNALGRRLFQMAGLYRRGLVFHELRRGAASAWRSANVDLDTIRCQLGHSKINTTQLYFLEDQKAKAEAGEKGLV